MAVQAQDDPDLRNLEPFVMVIVDTSGSMERLTGCECATPSCVECLPKCDQPTAPLAQRKNRWAFTLEALTGQFNDFQCSTVTRTVANVGNAYDVGYYLPYNQPWKCRDLNGVVTGSPVVCPYPTVGPAVQDNLGVLDTYSGRLRFGLMTFDGVETYTGANLVKVSQPFNVALSESQAGMWSYGGFKAFHYPNCAEDYAMDTGVRSSVAAEGGLITINSNACPSPPCSIFQVNESIQNALLRTRPYGGTPIAASLTDLFYHFKTDLTDSYGGCRDRYALLITDGYPDLDYRDYGCDCKNEGPGACGSDDPALQKCPYDRPEEVARQLVQGVNQDPQMKQLFVIGVSVADAKVKQRLNDIAEEGGSTVPDVQGNFARFADNFAVLTSTLDTLFGGLTKPVSRSVPAFVSGKTTQYRLTAGFQKALGAPKDGIAPPWTGLIERQRFGCTDNIPGGLPLDTSKGDIFQDTLNGTTGDTRRLWTAFPSSPTAGQLDGHLTRGYAGASCSGTTGDGSTLYCSSDTDLEDAAVTPALYNFTIGDVDAQKSELVKWMYGRSGSVRLGKRLGDIYHSSPTVWREGPQDVTDSTYSTFLAKPEVGRKPLVMYVGSNDGILHAFSVEAYNGTTVNNTAHLSTVYVAGQEMWGFVPPMLIDTLKDQLQLHKFGMDATPVIKDAFYYRPRLTSASADDGYHTVLVTGMRGGGEGYVALDISDPIAPKFLWQFAEPGTSTVTPMGKTYGKPVIAQIDVKFSTPSKDYDGVRGVVILPGGVGSKPTTANTNFGCRQPENNQLTSRDSATSYRSAAGFGGELNTHLFHRELVPCWNDKGRALYFIDLETGFLIKKISLYDGTSNRVFPSPVVGSPTVYPDAVGSIAKEGFVIDADGVMWRIDVSAREPKPALAKEGWTVRPYHDLFWDAPPSALGETSYEVPILSVDENKRLVVIAATGDTDNFDKPTSQNRVVSLTQHIQSATGTPADYRAVMNWEMRERPLAQSTKGLIKSELVTGSMALFQGRLFLGTFAPVVNVNDPCQFGRGRLWSVHYNKRDTTNPNKNFQDATTGTFGPQMIDLSAPETDVARNGAFSGASLFNTDINSAPDNLMIFGLGATQLSCSADPTDIYDNAYFGKVPTFKQSAPPSIWIVAQTSGSQSFVQNNSALGAINVQLDRPPTLSKVTSWAASTD